MHAAKVHNKVTIRYKISIYVFKTCATKKINALNIDHSKTDATKLLVVEFNYNFVGNNTLCRYYI